MEYFIVIISIVFVVIGFVFTESNAKYLLSSHSGLSETGGNGIDYTGHVRFFRTFHIFLAISLLCFGLGLFYTIDENAAGIFTVVYPMLGYVFYLLMMRKSQFEKRRTAFNLCMPVLLLALCLAIWLSYRGLQPNSIEIQQDRLLISGSYGMKLPFTEIKSVEVVDELPSIRHKRHGYAMGDILKGEFRTESSELVRILADRRFAPYVKIQTKRGKHIYFTCADVNSATLSERIYDKIAKTE